MLSKKVSKKGKIIKYLSMIIRLAHPAKGIPASDDKTDINK